MTVFPSHVTREQFSALVEEMPNGCHQWLGRTYNGYGQWLNGYWAHRLAYILFRGPIPSGLELDHLCRNKGCVNPQHLEVVTRQINANRAMSAVVPLRTHCRQGHAWTPENTIWCGWYRRCRECARKNWRDYRERRRLKARRSYGR